MRTLTRDYTIKDFTLYRITCCFVYLRIIRVFKSFLIPVYVGLKFEERKWVQKTSLSHLSSFCQKRMNEWNGNLDRAVSLLPLSLNSLCFFLSEPFTPVIFLDRQCLFSLKTIPQISSKNNEWIKFYWKTLNEEVHIHSVWLYKL